MLAGLGTTLQNFGLWYSKIVFALPLAAENI